LNHPKQRYNATWRLDPSLWSLWISRSRFLSSSKNHKCIFCTFVETNSGNHCMFHVYKKVAESEKSDANQSRFRHWFRSLFHFRQFSFPFGCFIFLITCHQRIMGSNIETKVRLGQTTRASSGCSSQIFQSLFPFQKSKTLYCLFWKFNAIGLSIKDFFHFSSL